MCIHSNYLNRLLTLSDRVHRRFNDTQTSLSTSFYHYLASPATTWKCKMTVEWCVQVQPGDAKRWKTETRESVWFWLKEKGQVTAKYCRSLTRRYNKNHELKEIGRKFLFTYHSPLILSWLDVALETKSYYKGTLFIIYSTDYVYYSKRCYGNNNLSIESYSAI